jgi:hypothetical protein
MIIDLDSKVTDTIFFFGAGASVDANVPDTYAFVQEFVSYLERDFPTYFQTISKIIKILTEEYDKSIDIEKLIECLQLLIKREYHQLLAFYETPKCRINYSQKHLQDIMDKLQDFIRQKVIIKDESNLEYLKELLNFDYPLEIYSTNYDTCIEQLCHMTYRRYTDGLEVYWDPKNFEKDFDVKHYKLHGSVIWFQNSKSNECVKIPIQSFGKEELRLIYGESVEPLLIYPAQKADYMEPLTDLQLMLKQRLSNKKTRFVIVVGYSFRDKYILRMFWDAARKNDNLYIILISPSAGINFNRTLRDINPNNPSRLYNRVICLPYPFASIINKLRNFYLQNLREIIEAEKEIEQRSRLGTTLDMLQPDNIRLLKKSIDCEFEAKTEEILNKTRWDAINFETPHECFVFGLKGLLHSIIVKEATSPRDWLNRVNFPLTIFNKDNLDVHVDIFDGVINVVFQGTYQNIPFRLNSNEIIKKWLEPAFEEQNKKLEVLGGNNEPLNSLENSFEKLRKLETYLKSINARLSWERYFETRKNYGDTNELKKFLADKPPVEKEITRLVLLIERKEIAKIFGGSTLKLDIKNSQGF